MRDEPVQKAINAVGSASELGKRLGITSQAISQWQRIPIRKLIEIEAATGIPREQLRPDLYRQPEVAA